MLINQLLSKLLNLNKPQAIDLTNTVNRFMLGRYRDIQVLANLPFLTNAKISARTSDEEKQAVLNRLVEAYKAYDSIAVLDLEGNLIVQSTR